MATQTSSIVSVKPQESQQVGRSLLQLAMMRLRRDKLTLVAIAVVVMIALLSLLAPLICKALGVDATSTTLTREGLKLSAKVLVLVHRIAMWM